MHVIALQSYISNSAGLFGCKTLKGWWLPHPVSQELTSRRLRGTPNELPDGKNASWDKNPQAYQIRRQKVDSKTTLKLQLAPGGGTAVRAG